MKRTHVSPKHSSPAELAQKFWQKTDCVSDKKNRNPLPKHFNQMCLTNQGDLEPEQAGHGWMGSLTSLNETPRSICPLQSLLQTHHTHPRGRLCAPFLRISAHLCVCEMCVSTGLRNCTVAPSLHIWRAPDTTVTLCPWSRRCPVHTVATCCLSGYHLLSCSQSQQPIQTHVHILVLGRVIFRQSF